MAVQLLVSVRTADEALAALRGGADFIDLKEPRTGALGGLPRAIIRGIVAALREAGSTLPVSATIGDVPLGDLNGILDCVGAVGSCGVDIVKVGIERGPQAFAVLDALAACSHDVVPVFLADQGLDFAAVAHAAGLPLAGVMVDTADKRAGSLFDALPAADLQRFVDTVRAAGQRVGVAGALRVHHLPAVHALAPDFAGFRSAVCNGSRGSALDAARLQALVAVARASAVPTVARFMGGLRVPAVAGLPA
ncbi:(5-formylfuran-3-yl)methyl phosphate synthase [Aquincola sp. MAHUQ-54]|uniref:(5-formylfuran-3-yl)methyl phosphate synthase n=1 Tax=Aquincola agrisoli TaxID=3119538 RepID=A0AAW9Q8F0_9BURK